jgi:hypothetical protein
VPPAARREAPHLLGGCVLIRIGDRWVDEFDEAALEEAMRGMTWVERAEVAENHPLFGVSPYRFYKAETRQPAMEGQETGEEPAEPE